jgi:hypothetical protein
MATPQDLAPELHHQDKGPTILAVACTLTTLSTFFVGARLYVRGKILHRIGLDDWLIILSLVGAIAGDVGLRPILTYHRYAVT